MKPKILSWNVRGLNEGEKRLRVRNLLRQWEADIICLQETKLEFISDTLVRNLWSCPFAVLVLPSLLWCLWLYVNYEGQKDCRED
jgi:hypothetical protein